MTILLISPVLDLKNPDAKSLLIPSLGLYILQGLTPKQHTVKIIQEGYDQLDYNEECDLVGISCMTANAPRAYEIAAEFKKRGKKVIMGGIHPTILPEEALLHADAVVVGEAEDIWQEVLEDFKNKKLKRIYNQPRTDLNKFIPIDYRSIRRGVTKQLPLLTSRGCFYHCDFCSIPKQFKGTIKHVPVENIVRYIKESKTKYVTFLDDNIVSDPIYAKELFKALIPLKITWSSQSSLSIARDHELLELAAKSGGKFLAIGIESIVNYQLKNLKKQFDSTDELERAIFKMRKAGFLIHAFIMFGFDSDDKSVFKQTIDFLIKNKICSASFNILTPYPGLSIFEKFKNEGRLLTTNWKYYCHNIAVFKPKNMSAFELQTNLVFTKKKFYCWLSILKRSIAYSNNPRDLFIYLVINFVYKYQQFRERRWNTTPNKLEYLKY